MWVRIWADIGCQNFLHLRFFVFHLNSLVARGGVFLGGRHDHWWWWLTPVDPLIGAQCPPWPFANCGWLLALAVLASSSGAGTPLTCLLLRACSNTQFLLFLSFYSFSFSSPFLLIFLSQSSYLASFSPSPDLRFVAFPGVAGRPVLSRQVAEELLQQQPVPSQAAAETNSTATAADKSFKMAPSYRTAVGTTCLCSL